MNFDKYRDRWARKRWNSPKWRMRQAGKMVRDIQDQFMDTE